MLAASYGPVEDIEILWTLIATIGLLFSLVNLKESIADKRYLRQRDIRNGRKAIADTTVMAESMRAFKQAIFVAVGIFAMSLPGVTNTAHQPLKVLILGILVRWGFITAAALTAAQSYLAYRLRKQLVED